MSKTTSYLARYVGLRHRTAYQYHPGMAVLRLKLNNKNSLHWSSILLVRNLWHFEPFSISQNRRKSKDEQHLAIRAIRDEQHLAIGAMWGHYTSRLWMELKSNTQPAHWFCWRQGRRVVSSRRGNFNSVCSKQTDSFSRIYPRVGFPRAMCVMCRLCFFAFSSQVPRK